jgi:hypothetical protein
VASLLKHRLLLRFVALGILTFCFAILSRSSVNTPLTRRMAPSPSPVQKQAPAVRKEVQPEAPLVISALRTVSWDGRYLEVAMDLVNVSDRAIRAYAIKQASEGKTSSGKVSFISLEASNKDALRPNQSTTFFDVYQPSSSENQQGVFFVDYVEFSDGTKWGPDSAKSAERSEGQRAAADMLGKRLLKILNNGSPSDVFGAIVNGEANIEPPAGRSAEWKEGFRFGCKSIELYIKRAQATGRLDQELREFSQRLKRGQ